MSRNELIKKLKNNFSIKELVCKHCYSVHKENAWQFLSTELLSTIYVLRYIIFNKPITINTWHKKGNLTQRGLRCNLCQLVKSKTKLYLSAHNLGKAIDFNVQDYNTEEVYKMIKDNLNKFEYPIRIESNSTEWAHVDVYQPNSSEAKIIEFYG